MTSKSVIKLACKIFAIYLAVVSFMEVKNFVIYFLPPLLSVDEMYDVGGGWRVTQYTGTLTSAVFTLFGAVLLARRSQWIADILIREEENEFTFSLDRVVLLELAVIIVGLVSAVSGAVHVLNSFVLYVQNNNDHESGVAELFWKREGRLESLIIAVIELIIGVLVTSNGKVIAKRIIRIGDKNAGEATDPLSSNGEQKP
jgi:hypothetical protein